MPILILKEKHGDRHFSFSTPEELQLLAAHIIRERHKEGYWYEDTSNIFLRRALKGDNKAALSFLRCRQGLEYEDFEIVEPETLDAFKGEES